MSLQLKGLLTLFAARLSRRIVFWVFASLVVIETIILIPSVQRRQEELLAQFREITSAKITWLISKYPAASAEKILSEAEKLQTNSMFRSILGGVIYDIEGRKIGEFGELPQLSVPQIKAGNLNLLNSEITRYDTAWVLPPHEAKYILIIRNNTDPVRQELYAFMLRIAGLVIIISVFITLSTMVTLAVIVINPILRLRDDLRMVETALIHNGETPAFYTLTVQRQDELGEVITAFKHMFQQIREEIMSRRQAEVSLRAEQEKSEQLLLNILPAEIAEQLKREQSAIANRFEQVTILFADIVDFTGLSSRIAPTEVVNLLNQIFSTFDRLVETYGLEKIKTIGDAYMVVGGLPTPRPDHASAIAQLALEMRDKITSFQTDTGQPFQIRIGINTGPVVAGVIGLKKFSYDLWGDAVNLASRMESHGVVGKIQVTEATYKLLQDKFQFEKRGSIRVKGRGEMITYFLVDRNPIKG